MGAVVRMIGGTMLLVALVTGCGGERFRLHVPEPAGANLIVEAGATTSERSLPVPFIAEFTPMDGRGDYSVRLVLPPDVAARYGGRGETVLYGKLTIHGATQLARERLVELTLRDVRIASLVRGEVSEIEAWVDDPTVGQRLARIELRARPY